MIIIIFSKTVDIFEDIDSALGDFFIFCDLKWLDLLKDASGLQL
jgi:hypothetical protein